MFFIFFSFLSRFGFISRLDSRSWLRRQLKMHILHVDNNEEAEKGARARTAHAFAGHDDRNVQNTKENLMRVTAPVGNEVRSDTGAHARLRSYDWHPCDAVHQDDYAIFTRHLSCCCCCCCRCRCRCLCGLGCASILFLATFLVDFCFVFCLPKICENREGEEAKKEHSSAFLVVRRNPTKVSKWMMWCIRDKVTAWWCSTSRKLNAMNRISYTHVSFTQHIDTLMSFLFFHFCGGFSAAQFPETHFRYGLVHFDSRNSCPNRWTNAALFDTRECQEYHEVRERIIMWCAMRTTNVDRYAFIWN